MNNNDHASKPAAPAPPPLTSVRLADLLVDPSYQRGLKEVHKKIARRFNPNSAGVLIVARRQRGLPDDGLYIIDGQQRRAAMTLAGIEEWLASVIESSGPAYEAEIFRQYNSSDCRTQLKSMDIFKAALAAGDEVALGLAQVVRANGLVMGTGNRAVRRVMEWPIILCAGTLHGAARISGLGPVDRALRLVVAAWPGVADALRELIIAGVIRLVVRHGASFGDDAMVKAMGQLMPATLCYECRKMSGVHADGVMRLIVLQYNKRRIGKGRINVFGGGDQGGPA